MKNRAFGLSLALAGAIFFHPNSGAESSKTAPPKTETEETLQPQGLQYPHADDLFPYGTTNLSLRLGNTTGDISGNYRDYAARLGMENLFSLSGRIVKEKIEGSNISTETDTLGTYTTDEGGECTRKSASIAASVPTQIGKFSFALNKSKRSLNARSDYYDETISLLIDENRLMQEAESDSIFLTYSNKDIVATIARIKNKTKRTMSTPMRMPNPSGGILTLDNYFEEEIGTTGYIASADYLLMPTLDAGIDLAFLKLDNTSTKRLYNIFTMNTDTTPSDEGGNSITARGRAFWKPQGPVALSGSIGYTTLNREEKSQFIADAAASLNIAGDFGLCAMTGIDMEGNTFHIPAIYLLGPKEKIHNLLRFAADQRGFLRDDAAHLSSLESKVEGLGPSFVLGAHIYNARDGTNFADPKEKIQRVRPFFAMNIADICRMAVSGEMITDKSQQGTEATAMTGINLGKIIREILGVKEIPNIEAVAGIKGELRKKQEGEGYIIPKCAHRELFFGIAAGIDF